VNPQQNGEFGPAKCQKEVMSLASEGGQKDPCWHSDREKWSTHCGKILVGKKLLSRPMHCGKGIKYANVGMQ